VAAALVALLAALLAATPCKSEEDAVGGETLGPLSPVLVSLVSQQAIVPVLGSDGRYHVLYELEMLNTLGAPADLRSVEVLDADDGKTLLALSAADIIKGEYLQPRGDRHGRWPKRRLRPPRAWQREGQGRRPGRGRPGDRAPRK
jgi:hypothetical protein